jgi:hypothetical protein
LFSLGSFSKITDAAPSFGLRFYNVQIMYIISLTKMDWAAFWAFFSPTHLVTLAGIEGKQSSPVNKS